VLTEFGLDVEVISVGPHQRVSWRVRDLLPDAFSRERLA
jgi:hypothetical protein